MSKILFITPMWHDATAPNDPKVCNYFVESWVQLGHTVTVIHLRSCFPAIYKYVAKLVPGLYKKLSGDNSELRTDSKITKEECHGATVFTYPVFKYIPHGKVSVKSLNKLSCKINIDIKGIGIEPDFIIGHFCNPSAELIMQLAKHYPSVKTALILHEGASTLARVLPGREECVLNAFSSIGYRSMSIQRDVESHFKLKNNRFICHSGIASSFLQRPLCDRQWEDGPIRHFLFVGRLVYYKHPKANAEALVNVFGKKGFEYNIIGKKDVASEDLTRYVKSEGLENSVHILGAMEREQIITWYDKSDCYVMISRHEVFGLVYLEAMARGCITIAGTDGGMEGIIKHGENGFLCDPGNVEQLSEIIREINKMTAAQKKFISDNAIKTARKFSDLEVATRYLSNIENDDN